MVCCRRVHLREALVADEATGALQQRDEVGLPAVLVHDLSQGVVDHALALTVPFGARLFARLLRRLAILVLLDVLRHERWQFRRRRQAFGHYPLAPAASPLL